MDCVCCGKSAPVGVRVLTEDLQSIISNYAWEKYQLMLEMTAFGNFSPDVDWDVCETCYKGSGAQYYSSWNALPKVH